MFYYVVPKLVEQPTWGGDLIASTKDLKLQDIKIGQSYEFSTDAEIIEAKELQKLKPSNFPYYLGSNKKGDEKLFNAKGKILKLESLDLLNVFGMRRIPNILIKFTQAKGNSYQVHPKIKTGKYQPKPESWFFLEKGKATLGINPEMEVDYYKQVCEAIYKKTQEVSKQVQKKEIDIDTARRHLQSFIEVNSPSLFVNTVSLTKRAIVENTRGGIHHSWEEDDSEIPMGNVVYEVQQDVEDSVSTIRSFDKGKLLDDGSHRELDIDAYFENLDTSKLNNSPDALIKYPIKLKDLKDWKLNKIFKNHMYHTDELIVYKTYKIETLGFRHIFVKEGTGVIKVDDQEYNLYPGQSYILSAEAKRVGIKCTTKSAQKIETPESTLDELAIEEEEEIPLDRPKLILFMTYPGNTKF